MREGEWEMKKRDRQPTRHAELVSAFMDETLKQVQGDSQIGVQGDG